MLETLKIKLPKDFRNCSITVDNYLIANTNCNIKYKEFKKKITGGKMVYI